MKHHAAALVFWLLLCLGALLAAWITTHCGVEMRLLPESGVAYDPRVRPVQVWVCRDRR